MQKTLALTTLLIGPALAAEQWSWTASENICMGYVTNCDDMVSCTKIAVGPCEGSETTSPSAYLTAEFVGTVFVDHDKYLKDPTTQMKMINFAGPGYRDTKSGISDTGGGEYAYMMVGNKIGSEGEYQGYMGVASYLNTGKQKIKKNEGVVYIVEPDFNSNEGGDARTKRDDSHSDSDIGAPAGPYDVCISERKSDGSCGADQVFNTSTFKYSIFGCMKRYPEKGQEGFPAEMDRWGLRMKLSTVGFDPNKLKLNDRDYHKERELDDIRKLSIMHKSGGVEIGFPYKFNAGSFSKDSTDKFYFRETKSDMNIVVHNATRDGSIYIDYFFEEWIMNSNDYMVYDPVLKFVKYTPDQPSAAPMAATVNVFTVALLGIFSVITLQA